MDRPPSFSNYHWPRVYFMRPHGGHVFTEQGEHSYVIYMMSAQAENTFEALNFADPADHDKYNPVLIKSDEHLVPKRNIVF